jgi:hypothetical protein
VKAIVAGIALLALAGCGGGGHKRPPQPPAGAADAARGYLAPAELRRDVGNAFRAGLDRLALMSQPPDDASILATDLPKGLLDRVVCAAAGPRPSTAQPWPWRCRVRWETAGGRAQATRYTVQLLPTRCFAATADPALPPRQDATIQTYSEHPLNTFVSLGRGC